RVPPAASPPRRHSLSLHDALPIWMTRMWAGEGNTRHDPVTGPENAIAPPLHLTANDDGTVDGVFTLGLAYQGPPGHVHGGISALDRKSTRLNSSHVSISYAVFCLK